MQKTPSSGMRVAPEIEAALASAAKDGKCSVSALIENILVKWLQANAYLPGGSKPGIKPTRGNDPAASIKIEDLTAENDE